MLKTPLFDEHLRLQARMTEFAGWSMPVWYEGIRKEHVAVRERAGLYDDSHMGRLVVSGPDRERFVDRLSTNRIIGLAPGVARYTLFCDETGGVIDDLLVMAEEVRLLIVCNASIRDRVARWMTEQ